MTRIYRIPPPPTGLQDERLRRWLTILRDTLADSDSTGLQTQIDANEAAITAIDSQVTAIDTTAHILTLLQGAITETELFTDLNDRIDLIDNPTTGLIDRMTAAEGDILTAQGAITSLESDVAANASATAALDTRVTTAEGAITAQASDISTLQSGLSDAENDISGNATAISGIDTRVTTAEGTISAQGTAITTVQADVVTAQATADAKINTYAQDDPPGAPLVVGDIWIDTNDGNRPYRWSGSAWVDAQDQLTITNASAISALTVDVDANTSGVTSNASAITALDVRVTSNETDVAQAIADAAGAQATADGKVTTFFQTTAPTAEGTGDLWFDTDDGYRAYRWSGSAWVDIQDTSIGQAIADAAGAQATADGKVTTFFQATPPTADAVGDLWFDTDDGNHPYRWSGSAWVDAQDGSVTANASAISSLSATVTTQGGLITANASDITQLQSDVGDNTAAISSEATTRATNDGLAYAEYTLKLDVNGYVAGFGIAVDSGASGPISSAFIVRASEFAIAFPGTTWAATTAYGLNAYALPSVATGYQYRASTAGTSGGTEPTWPTTPGSTVGDGTVAWTCETLSDVIPFVVGLVEGVPTVGIDGNLVVDGTLKTNAIEVGTLTGFVVQTAASGERIVLNGATYEAEFYGDRGDATVELLATIGIRAAGGDNTIIYAGSANADHTAVYGVSGGSVGVAGSSFGTDKPGVAGFGVDIGGRFGFESGGSKYAQLELTALGATTGRPTHSLPGGADGGQFYVESGGQLFYNPYATSATWCQLAPSFFVAFLSEHETGGVTIYESYNVSSVTYVSGSNTQFDITFANTLRHAHVGIVGNRSGTDADAIRPISQSATTCRIDIQDSNETREVFVIGFGA